MRPLPGPGVTERMQQAVDVSYYIKKAEGKWVPRVRDPEWQMLSTAPACFAR